MIIFCTCSYIWTEMVFACYLENRHWFLLWRMLLAKLPVGPVEKDHNDHLVSTPLLCAGRCQRPSSYSSWDEPGLLRKMKKGIGLSWRSWSVSTWIQGSFYSLWLYCSKQKCELTVSLCKMLFCLKEDREYSSVFGGFNYHKSSSAMIANSVDIV